MKSECKEECKEYNKIVSFDIGLKNLSYCIIGKDGKIIDWDNVDIYHKDPGKQGEKLWKMLQKIINDSNTNDNYEVVIEKQMAARMKRIESYVFMYFLDRKMKGSSNISKVTLFHAKHKLKYYDKQPNDLPLGNKKYASKYANNKYKGKEQCRVIIHREGEQDIEFIKKYKSSKKKDDLADSFLQGRAYLKMKKKS